jgi:hypothetical protein
VGDESVCPHVTRATPVARPPPNAHVKLQGAAVMGLAILTVHYLTLVHNLMPVALVSFNM